MLPRLILLLLVVGCGTHQPPSRLASTDNPSQLVIMAMGGRNSCEKKAPYSPKSMSMYVEVEKALIDLSPLYDTIRVIYSCFRADGELYYIDDRDSEVKKGSTQDLAASVRQTSGPVIVVGHSYGGWLAMQTLLHGSFQASLFTIDPISPKNCAFTKPQNWLGCIKAPTDIPYDVVAQKTSAWVNFFQTSTLYLHSSEIPQARKNIRLSGSGHTTIDNHETVWQEFLTYSKTTLSKSFPARDEAAPTNL